MSEPIRILYVDDSTLDRELIRDAFEQERRKFTISEAASWAEFNQCLEKGEYDVVLTDFNIHGVEGLQVLDAVKARMPGIPVVLVTGTGSEQVAVEAMKRGAADYVIKSPKHIRRLPLAITTVLAKHRLQEREKRNNEALRETNIRLEKALADLHRMQKNIVRKERLNALGQIASGIVHDLNNSLMCIIGACDGMISNPKLLDDREAAMKLLKVILAAAKDGERIVERLSHLHQHDTLEVEPVDLARLVDDVVGMTQYKWKKNGAADERNITVEADLKGIPPVMASGSQIREVLMNVILNAVDAMPRGGLIRIAGEHDHKAVTMRISDTGDGMDEEVRQRCFEAFFTTKGRNGTGLGLAVADGIIQRHGGTIEVESQAGRGTTIIIRLPIEGEPAGK